MSPVSCLLPNLSTFGIGEVIAPVTADPSSQYPLQFLVSEIRSPSRIRDQLVAGEFPVPLAVGWDLRHLDDARLTKAGKKLSAVLGFLKEPSFVPDIRLHAQLAGVHVSTFYRFFARYRTTAGRLEDFLYQRAKSPEPRLAKPVNEIIESKIETYYLKAERPNVASVWRKIKDACVLRGLKPPHVNTIRLRIQKIDLEKLTKARFGSKKARDRFSMVKLGFVQRDGPLSLVQIDHTPVDVIILDEESRLPIGRPNITIVLDTYSRMVLGFFVTLDEPSALSVGVALGHAILPKKPWLDEIGVDAEWPCQGIPICVFADNAFEFRGKMLGLACLNWRIDLQWRPLKRPEFGGHIERFMRTMAQVVHEIPGTTFSDVKEKGDYNSARSACMTLRELEAWLATWITKDYHLRSHQGLEGRCPMMVWKDGLVKAEAVTGKPSNLTVSDPQKLRMDLLPFIERTVQQYGFKIFGEFYYQDFLRRFVHSLDPEDSRRKKTYTIRYDPRDMSRVYFWDAGTGEYFAVPWRDPSRQPCSLWELRVRHQRAKDKAALEEDDMAAALAHQDLEERISSAKAMTQKQRRVHARKKFHKANNIHRLLGASHADIQDGLPGDPRSSLATNDPSFTRAESLPTWSGLIPFSEIE